MSDMDPRSYSVYRPQAVTAMGLNVNEPEHRETIGSDVSNNSRPAPLRARALTVTSNDNPRAAKRRANDSTRHEEHTHANIPHYNALVTSAPNPYERGHSSIHPTYGHAQAQSPAGTVSSVQMHQELSSATGGRSVHSAYGYTQGHASERVRIQANATEVFRNANTSNIERLTYGHTQGHGPEPTRVRTDAPTGNTYTTASQTGTWHLDHGLRLGHGYTPTRPSELIDMPPPAPAPFRTMGSEHSILPPLRPSNPMLPHRLPPIHAALTNPVAPLHSEMRYFVPQPTVHVSEPPRAPMAPTNIADTAHSSTMAATMATTTAATTTTTTAATTVTTRHPPITQQTSARIPTTSASARSHPPGLAPHASPMPSTHVARGSTQPQPRASVASHAPRTTAPTKRKPTNGPSGAPAHIPRTPKPARSPSPPIIISSSPTSDVWAACDRSRTPMKPKVEEDDDEVVAYDPFDDEESEGSVGDKDNKGDKGDEDDEGSGAMDDEEKAWAMTHPPSIYPGGPRLVRADTRVKTFSATRYRRHVRNWEEGYIIEEFCQPHHTKDRLWDALKVPQVSGKKFIYHKSIRTLSKDTFMGSRTERKIHEMLRSIATTYTLCRSLIKLIGPRDYNRPYDTLVAEISPLITEHKLVHVALKDLTAWHFICYLVYGENSWYTRLHAHLETHPKYKDIEMHSGRISPAPARSSRGRGRGRGHGSRGGTPRDSPSTRGDPLSAPPKPVPPRSGNRVTSTAPKGHGATSRDASPAAANNATRKAHNNQREFDDQVVGLKKQSEATRLGLLTRKLEHNEHFQEEAHRLDVARLALERARTEATFNAERQKEHLAFLLSIRDRGKQGEDDTLYDEATCLLQGAIQSGVTLFPVPKVVASLSDPVPAPTSRLSATSPHAPSIPLQTAGAGPSTGPGTSRPRLTSAQSANRLSPNFIDANQSDSEDEVKLAGWHGGWSQSKKYRRD